MKSENPLGKLSSRLNQMLNFKNIDQIRKKYIEIYEETLKKNQQSIQKEGLGPKPKAEQNLIGEVSTTVNLVALPPDNFSFNLKNLPNLPEDLIYFVKDPHVTIADFGATTNLTDQELEDKHNKVLRDLENLAQQQPFELQIYALTMSAGGITALFLPVQRNTIDSMHKYLKSKTDCTIPEIIHMTLVRFTQKITDEKIIEVLKNGVNKINGALAENLPCVIEMDKLVLTNSGPYHKRDNGTGEVTIIKDFMNKPDRN